MEVRKSKKINNKTYTAVFDSDYVASDEYTPTKVFGSVFVFDEEGKKVEFTFEANGLAASVTASDDVAKDVYDWVTELLCGDADVGGLLSRVK